MVGRNSELRSVALRPAVSTCHRGRQCALRTHGFKKAPSCQQSYTEPEGCRATQAGVGTRVRSCPGMRRPPQGSTASAVGHKVLGRKVGSGLRPPRSNGASPLTCLLRYTTVCLLHKTQMMIRDTPPRDGRKDCVATAQSRAGCRQQRLLLLLIH